MGKTSRSRQGARSPSTPSSSLHKFVNRGFSRKLWKTSRRYRKNFLRCSLGMGGKSDLHPCPRGVTPSPSKRQLGQVSGELPSVSLYRLRGQPVTRRHTLELGLVHTGKAAPRDPRHVILDDGPGLRVSLCKTLCGGCQPRPPPDLPKDTLEHLRPISSPSCSPKPQPFIPTPSYPDHYSLCPVLDLLPPAREA